MIATVSFTMITVRSSILICSMNIIVCFAKMYFLPYPPPIRHVGIRQTVRGVTILEKLIAICLHCIAIILRYVAFIIFSVKSKLIFRYLPLF